MAPSSAPVVSIEPEFCPQAVIDWYKLTGSTEYRRGGGKRDLSLKAKQHLRALGWNLWYIDKQGRWELRYTSPINGRNHISLRKACETCIAEGGCGPENVPLILETKGLQVKHDHDHQPAQPRTCKRKKRESFDDDDDEVDHSQPTSELDQASSTTVISSSAQAQVVSRKSKKQRVQSSSNPCTVISWLIDNNAVLLESRVFCRGRYNVVRKGKLLHCGIECDCCGLVFGPTNFEAHAGCTKHHPFTSIFLEDGRSLLDCHREALSSSQQKNHDAIMQRDNVYKDNNDSICSICRYGGELILCDRCPSAFHLGCLGLEKVPDGDWFCPPCCCKICNRPTYGEECADNVDCSILVCDQCEHKYHIRCLKTRGFTSNLENQANKNWFCNADCENIFFSLQKLIGKPIVVGADNLTWILLKTPKSDNHGDLNSEDLERMSQIESKLSVALGVFHECFDPVIDNLTGRDIIPDVVFSRGSELNRSNFRGFYTVILERNDQVISAATIRIYGQKVAELPFVATGRNFRRLGMCSILMNELEKQLTHLGIERLILPSSPSVIDTWTNSFGFARMTDLDKSQFLDYTFLGFQDTTMCHKLLRKLANGKFKYSWV